ncbi:MAG: tRNA (guanosine(37)-N1)-methyltransferase TrmD [Treponema sp.]|nr:tRNA (guanosine(37)-N1)-methyltransferase TrmD [Treponema sp.]
MKYTVLSLFPEITDAYFASSIMARAVSRGIVEYRSVNIRDYALDKHRTCDDAPYGGGPGMLMLAEPLGRALEAARAASKPGEVRRVIYLSPSGRPFNQELARELAAEGELVLLCGRYEGIDQRIIDAYVDDEISVGDYVLSSGEAAALILIDATYRLVEQVITPASLEEESFSGGLLEYPQYTRPEIYGTLRVPEVLLSGHHENIRRWRLEKQVEKTLALRPDLIRRGEEEGLFDDETRKIIDEMKRRCRQDDGEGER